MKKALLGSIVVAFLLATRPASAQDEGRALGHKGGVVLSGERLFGFIHADATSSASGMDRTTHVNSISLLGNGLGLLTIYAQPRLGFDVFAAEGLSLGASASYVRTSQSIDVPAGQVASNPVLSGYVLAPRVGYALPLGPRASVWPRLGFTFAHLETELSGGGATTTNGTSVYAVTIEAPFVFTVAPHFFLSLAPTLELGVGGSTSTTGGGVTGPSTDSKETDYGVLCGLGGFI